MLSITTLEQEEVCDIVLSNGMSDILLDALLGLRELLQANPWMIESSLTSLVNACVRIIGDEVRSFDF